MTDAPPVAFAVPDVDASDHEAVERVLRSRWLTTGEECLRLEEELATFLGAPHVVAVSSCTAALEIALTWLDLPAGARVGVPDWTFVSTALAAHRAGLEVVLLDADPDTLNVSPTAVAAALEEGLDALLPVHFGGVAVAPEVRAIAAGAGVPVVEDAAHALGAADERGPVNGRDVVAACYSFYATKNLSCGEGGAVATFDSELAGFARSWRLHGLSRDAWARYRPDAPVGASLYELVGPGLKANLPDLLAAVARSQLARFPSMQARRRRLVTAYREALEGLPVQCVPGKLDEGGADHLMVVVLPEHVERSSLVRRMAAEGVATSVHFQPLSGFGWVAEHARPGPVGLKVTTAMAPRVVSLPLHTSLGDADVERVVATLDRALRAGGG